MSRQARRLLRAVQGEISIPPVQPTITLGAVTVSVSGTTVSLAGSVTATGSVTFDGLNISIAENTPPSYPWVRSAAFSNGRTVTDETFSLTDTIQSLPDGDYVAYVSYSLDGQKTWTTGAKTQFTVAAPVPVAPNAPAIHLSERLAESVTIGWTAPTNPNGSITTYIIGCRLSSDQSVVYSTGTNGTTFSYQFVGLTQGTAYDFWVQAVNDSGLKSPVTTLAVTTVSVPGGTIPQRNVVFYTGANFTGTSFTQVIGDARSSLGADNNTVRSIKINSTPAKIYAYSEPGYDDGALVVTSSITDLAPYTFLGDRTFSAQISSFFINSIAEELPYVDAGQSVQIALRDASRLSPLANNLKFSNAQIDSLTLEKTDATSYNTFSANVVADSSLQSLFNLAGRNACSILYESADDVPIAHRQFKLQFVNPAGTSTYAGQSIYPESRMEIYRGFGSYASWNASSWFIQHEMSHMFSKLAMRYYFENADVRALEEGLADYVSLKAGTIPSALGRPAGGGNSWRDGYRTTGYFFDYIERRSPGFIRNLVASFTTTDVARKQMPWSFSIFPSLTTTGRTIDQLWADYKAWVPTQPASPGFDARVAASFTRPACGLEAYTTRNH